MKKYDEKSLFRVATNNDKIKIEVNVSDLAWLLKNSPNNGVDARVKRGKRVEFIEYIASALTNCCDSETGDTLIMAMFENIFDEIFCGDEEFIKSQEDED